MVSQLLGSMEVSILGCNDDPGPASMRGHIERNAIALLSAAQREGLDPASPHWLGRSSNRELVTNSGLWNQRHTTDQLAPGFLETFEAVIGSENA
jgi:hypothetical protein